MKTSIVSIALSIALALVFSASETTAKKQDSDKETASESDTKAKNNTTVVTIDASPDRVHAAALEALASIGCKIKKDNPLRIEAKRPNKVGLAVGSGGEKLFVSIKDLGDGSSEVTVVTKKTMVGVVGQKLWNEEVAQLISDAFK